MEIAIAQQPVNQIRIDKNIAMFGSDIQYAFKEQADLVLDVLIYSARKQQTDLFNMEEMDVKEFADMQGYPKNHLLEKAANPLQAEKEDITKLKKEDLFINKIENVLYTMAHERLTFKKKVRDFSKDEITSSISFYSLLNTVTKHTSTRRKDSFRYSYEISEVFKTHINRYFTHIDPERMRLLRKKNCAFLYLNLIALREIVLHKKEIATPDFDTLVKIAGINSSRQSDKKHKLTQKLRIINDVTDIGYTFKYVKKNGNHKYGLEIDFFENPLAIDKGAVLGEAVENETGRRLMRYFRDTYCDGKPYTKATFADWFYDSDKDKAFKYQTFAEVHYVIRKAKSLAESEYRSITAAIEYFTKKE